jgi:ATP-dependent helicase/nuclease subunit A
MTKISRAKLDEQDLQVRKLIEDELEQNYLVEAAAGTGKTTAMVNRMVALVATGKCRVQQIAAITFTRKAAAELRERFQGQLRTRALKGCEKHTSTEAQQRIAEAADQSEQAFVGTIHSLCATLLRERPVEFDVDPAFRELDASEDIILRERAWRENLADLSASKNPLLTQLQEMGLALVQLRSCFDSFIEYRDIQHWPTDGEPEFDFAPLKRKTQEYIQHMQTLIPTFPRERGSDKLMNYYEKIVRASDCNWNRPDIFFELLELFDHSPKITQGIWGKPRAKDNPGKAEELRWIDFRENWFKPAVDFWRGKRYRFVLEYVRRAVAVYERLKRASGGLDFQDLLMTATQGLRKHAELRSYFRQRFPFVLVDEFQDTDPVQAEMMLLLTSSDTSKSDWTQCTPSPGALFLVGDPKQSIYRFRRGDIVTYNRVKQILQSSGGRVLPLAKNFRSRESLISWNNQVYANKFGTGDNYSPQSEEMLVGRKDAVTTPSQQSLLDGVYKLSLPSSSKDNIERVRWFEADSVARFIRHAIDGNLQISRTAKELARGATCGLQPSDFMILPWGKKNMGVYIEALERYRLPFQVAGGNSLAGSEQLRWLLDCVRVIDDPQNPLPCLSLLRSLFGFSDADLYELRRAGGSFNYTHEVPSGLSLDLANRFNDIVSKLRQYRTWMRTLPYAVALHRIAEDLGLLAHAAASAEGNNQAGGLFKAIERLRYQSWDFDSAADLISCLEDIASEEDIDGCTALAPDNNVIRIMNLHKAKGLEAPIVFLVDTVKAFQGEPRSHIDRTSDQPQGYMGISAKVSQYHSVDLASPQGWKARQEEEKRFLAAEHNRLLYVATTRAANAMVISVGKSDSNWSSLHDSLSATEELPLPQPETVAERVKRFESTKDPTNITDQQNPQATSLPKANETNKRWQLALEKSYEVVSAKDLGMKGRSHSKRQAASGEYGYLWGSALHSLLELCHKRPNQDLRPIAMQLLEQYDLESDRLDELLSTARSVAASDIWQRAQRSQRCYSELPIEIFEPGETQSTHQGESEVSNQQPQLIRGVIDLIFEEPDGWVIVDYKTDDIIELEVPATIEQYRGQLAQYARIWTATTSFTIKSTGLYFTRLNRYEQL